MGRAQKWRERYAERVDHIVQETGWAVQYVADPRSPWAYTVGLTEAGLAELLVVDLTVRTAQALLNLAASHHLETTLQPDDTPVDIGRDVTVRVRPIDPACYTLAGAVSVLNLRYANRRRFTLVQLWWPDSEGLWPDSPFRSDHRQVFPPISLMPPSP